MAGPKVFPPLNLPPQSNPVHRSSTRAGGEEKSGSSPIIQGFLFGGAECGLQVLYFHINPTKMNLTSF